MKKVIIGVLSIIFFGIIISLPCKINDYYCSVFRNETEDSFINVPEVRVLEIVNGCGNSSGTGDHTDLYVAVLVETSLSEDDLENKFPNVYDVHDVKQKGNTTLAMEIIGLNFNDVKFDSNSSYYILEFVDRTAFSNLDLRGS